jgi:hypothetical protein
MVGRVERVLLFAILVLMNDRRPLVADALDHPLGQQRPRRHHEQL